MRKTISRILGLSALLALFPACSPQSDVEEATLDLSTETLTFTKEASEQTLTVSTNKESWSALSPQEATSIDDDRADTVVAQVIGLSTNLQSVALLREA